MPNYHDYEVGINIRDESVYYNVNEVSRPV